MGPRGLGGITPGGAGLARGAAARGRKASPRGGPRGGGPRGNPGTPARGGKRKGDQLQSSTWKRRNTATESWGNQPIAQQPLKQDMKQDLYGANSYEGNDGQEWYQDSYGQQWK